MMHEELIRRLHYEPETGVFTWKKGYGRAPKQGGVRAGGFGPAGYRTICIDGTLYLEHRLAWLYMHGALPVHHVDHINGNGLDNRISNLRDVSNQVNLQNMRVAMKNNRLGILGVRPKWKRFEARLRYDGKVRSLGVFDTPEEAHAAYLSAKRALHPGCTI